MIAPEQTHTHARPRAHAHRSQFLDQRVLVTVLDDMHIRISKHTYATPHAATTAMAGKIRMQKPQTTMTIRTTQKHSTKATMHSKR